MHPSHRRLAIACVGFAALTLIAPAASGCRVAISSTDGIAVIPGAPTADMDFVIGVVRTYGGEMPILDICKQIIKVAPERSSAWNEIAAALESTGVVAGEYGIVHAYETKREEIAAWKNDDHPRVQSFAVWLIESLDQMIISERQRADAGMALRKHRYGVSKDQL